MGLSQSNLLAPGFLVQAVQETSESRKSEVLSSLDLSERGLSLLEKDPCI